VKGSLFILGPWGLGGWGEPHQRPLSLSLLLLAAQMMLFLVKRVGRFVVKLWVLAGRKENNKQMEGKVEKRMENARDCWKRREECQCLRIQNIKYIYQ
jgi:hypothetical protein